MVHPKKEDLYHHFKAVSDRVDLPMLLYNNPQDTGNDLPFDLVERLANLDHIVAIKDSTFDYNVFWKTQCALADRVKVFIGPSTMFGAPRSRMRSTSSRCHSLRRSRSGKRPKAWRDCAGICPHRSRCGPAAT